MDRRPVRRALAVVSAAVLTLGLLAPTQSSFAVTASAGAPHAAPGATPENLDYCLAQCLNILPPGQNGYDTFGDLLANKVFGSKPRHADDQYNKYESLVWNYQTVTNDSLQNYYNPSSFGSPAGGVESSYSPRSDVTIYREQVSMVPHVRGTTRAGTMFGAGYASANDRMFLMDLLRHVGRGDLTSFAGGNPGNRQFEQDQWAAAPYTEADLQRQYDEGPARYGEGGRKLQEDVTAYVAGVNQWISDVKANKMAIPGEYTALGRSSIDPWKVTDVLATASLVGGLFGKGGGGEIRSSLALQAAVKKYGDDLGERVWSVFRAADDPEAETTVHNGDEFPYGQSPASAPGKAMPDPGSVVPVSEVADRTGTGVSAATAPVTAFTKAKPAMSNALVVSGADSASGHPLAVFGPQTGYFSPQLLMEIDLQGPGISAHGAAFAGVSMYVLLGRGQDYSWSATTAGQDIADTFAPELCEPDGKAPTLDSMYYLFHGQCLPIEVLKKRNDWKPSLADSTAAGGYTLVAQRTKLGLVKNRGMVGGKPVAFTVLRSTYQNEAASGIGFSMFNDPTQIKSAADFQRAANNVGYTFNWFYVDSQDSAYFNSGANPVRPAGTDPNFPIKAEPQYEWRGWNSDSNIAQWAPAAEHPQGVNQDWYTSWNNKQAPKFSAADDQYGYSTVYRNKPLDDRLKAGTANGKKMTKVDLVKAMEDAATVDLRGDNMVPLALAVIGSAPTGDATVDGAIAKLKAWVATGAHRITRTDPTPTKAWVYDDADAVRFMDAWWPLWVKSEFSSLGPELYTALTNVLPIDDPANHVGSSFQFGWYGYVSKDLRAVLGQPVKGGFPTPFCGGGDKAACRQTLIDTLKAATAVPATVLYPGGDGCTAGDQYCNDQIVHRPLGGIGQSKMQWQNRPTYQQVIEFPAKRGQDITNLAAGKVATASSTQGGYPASLAVDGDITTRWASNWTNTESLTVDLGSTQTVSRVVTDWEAAYGKAYTIQVSTDGTTWRDAIAVTGSDGGRDNISFASTSARYVRLLGTTRSGTYGYSIYEMAVYSY